MNTAFYKGNMDMEATKTGDMEKMEKIASYLMNEYGYEDSCGGDDSIILDHAYTIAESKKHYKEAKEATFFSDQIVPLQAYLINKKP
jgi:hypothetical protein